MSVERTPWSKAIYHNSTQQYRKDSATIFHSPYHFGRKNQTYSNPTFMSSSIFYPNQYSSNVHVKQASIKPLRTRRNSQNLLIDDEYKSLDVLKQNNISKRLFSAAEIPVQKKSVNKTKDQIRKKMLSSVMKDIENCINKKDCQQNNIFRKQNHKEQPIYFEPALNFQKIKIERQNDLIGYMKKHQKRQKVLKYIKRQQKQGQKQKAFYQKQKFNTCLQQQRKQKETLQKLYMQLLKAQKK